MKTVVQALGYGFIVLVVLGLLSFWPAGTFDYWQVWALLAAFAVATIAPSIYWGVTKPTVVQRRMRAGPAAETRTVQKLASTGLFVAFGALIVVSALDQRFGWSTLPAAVSVVGLVVVAVGFGIGILAVEQNSFAAADITVEAEQGVISTGLYGFVRHPMYFSAVIVMVGIPLALGSYWGLVAVVPGLIVLVLRILDEEQLLTQELSGYREYTRQVRYRLLPYLW